jgi:hypothetical protein
MGWSELVALLVAKGPEYVEAFRRGKIDPPRDAPEEAKSSNEDARLAALLAKLKGSDNPPSTGGGGGSSFGGLSRTQAIVVGGVAATALTVIATQ